MKITVIYDNREGDLRLEPKHGFSCLIEKGEKRILFDLGGDRDVFFSNAEKLGIDFGTIDSVVLSHKHWDHVSAFSEVLSKVKPEARVYLPRRFPNSILRKVPATLKFEKLKRFSVIDTDIYSLVLRAGFFLDEQALILKTPKGLVVITGCAHPGIVKILRTAQGFIPQNIHLVLGGFHLLNAKTPALQKVIQSFRELSVECAAPCHCSGEEGIHLFQEAYRHQFRKVGVGSILEISNG